MGRSNTNRAGTSDQSETSPPPDAATPSHNSTISTANTPTSSPTKQLISLAIPIFGQLIAEPTFILIDTAIVGHIGDTSLAGLSIGSTIILTAVGLCIFLAYSTTSQVARLIGAGRRREGLQTGLDGMWLALLIGAVLGIALFAAAEPLCRLLGGQGDVLDQAVIYTRAIVLGAPGMLLVYAANGIFRGLQKVRITLIAAVAGAVANTVLEVLFVLVLRWGIFGSGFATLIAQWFMGIFLAIPAIMWARADGASLRPHWHGIIAAGGDGFPLFIRTLAIRAAMVMTVASAARMGTDVLAGFQAVNSCWNFAMNMLDSVAIAGQTMVGNALGASDTSRARFLTRATGRGGILTGVVVGAGFAVIGLVAGHAFSPNPNIQTLVAVGMVTMGVFFPLQGWMMALDGVLIGAGDFRYLATTCTVVTLAHIAVLGTAITLVAPTLPNDLWRTAALWLIFNIVLMGGRTIANVHRASGDQWMRAV